MCKLKDIYTDLESDFNYYTADIENLQDKPFLKTAIVSHMECGNDYGHKLNSQFVQIFFDANNPD